MDNRNREGNGTEPWGATFSIDLGVEPMERSEVL